MPALSPETRTSRVGDLSLRAFDLALVLKLGAFLSGDDYFVRIDAVSAPPFPEDYHDPNLRRTAMPGVPVVFASPHEAFQDYVNPCLVVRRQDPQLAMERWNSQRVKYVAPAPGASQVDVVLGSGFGSHGGANKKPGTFHEAVASGFDAYETQRWPWPYDLHYTILSRVEGKGAETISARILDHMIRKVPPRDEIQVVDSSGLSEGYPLFTEGPNSLSEVIDVAHRVRGWSLSVKILGYLDYDDRAVAKAARVPPKPTASRL